LHEKEAQSICEEDVSKIPKARATFIDRWLELEERRRAQAGSDPRSLTEEDFKIESVADNTIDDDSDGTIDEDEDEDATANHDYLQPCSRHSATSTRRLEK
jgi:hypothetical protein